MLVTRQYDGALIPNATPCVLYVNDWQILAYHVNGSFYTTRTPQAGNASFEENYSYIGGVSLEPGDKVTVKVLSPNGQEVKFVVLDIEVQ